MARGGRSRSRRRSSSRSNDRSRSRSLSRGSRQVRSPSTSSNRQPPPLYALVKWLTGQHKGTFSHNVNVSWIRDFDPLGPFDTNGYAIEWRVGNQPRNGWHLYDGVVLEVSNDLQYLKRKEGQQVQSANLSANGRNWVGPRSPSTPTSHTLETPRQNQPDNELLRAFLDAVKLVQPLQSPGVAAAGSPGSPDPDQVKIGKVLSVSKSCYLQAKAARSPTAMTMYLTRAAFSRKRLLKSSYAGQKRKLPTGEVIQKPSLKRYQAMRDIQDFVLARFPVSQSTFGAAVNACTGEKAIARPEIEYEEQMSCSESEDDN